MSSRNLAGHASPSNPVYLEFERTDGDAKQLATNTKEVVGADGQVNYMKPLGLDDGSNIHWRYQVAMKVAERLGRPSGKNYVLRSWPEGYHMYCHLKGKQSAPRQDLYLLGSIHAKRFRSVPEFVPHALWLMTDPTLDRRNCECKYCAKVPQRVISVNLGYKHRTTPASSPAPGSRTHRVGRGDRERRSSRTTPSEYATVRRAPKPKPEKGPTQVMLQERYADVQAMYADTEAEMRRWFRVGELVWCALDPPIRGTDATANITFWPGLVDECSFKAETLPRPKSPSIHSADGDFEMEDGTESTVAHVGRGIETSNGTGSNVAVPYPITPHPGNPETESPLPWTVRQKNVYKVKLLAVNHDYIAVETQVLPYHGYKPSYDLLQSLQNVPIEQVTYRPEEIAAFNPCPPEAQMSNAEPSADDRHFAEAAAPYTLAMEIAAGIGVCWSPTDEWVFKMVVPPGSPARPPDTGETSARALQAPSIVNQTRYQGLWLGAERIWTDDLVRLKAARGQIAPLGSPQILAPSGPSKTSLAALTPEQLADTEILKAQGARDRGVFMQLEALFVVDVPDESGAGVHAECRGSGMLYELADEDWEEPPLGESGADTANGEQVKAQDAWTAAGLSTPPRPRNPGVTPELHVGQPFMSAPSPLKHLPPNQDAAASSSREHNNLPQTTTTARPDADAPNTQLSRSTKMSAVPLPPPPRGFRFRPILPVGYEVVVSLALVSGRYYPRLLAHPLLRPIVRDLQGDVDETATRPLYDSLFALEGILPGFFNASEATRWKPGRSTMVRDAAAERSAGLVRVWDTRRREAQEAAAQQEPVAAAAAAAAASATTEPGESQDGDVGMHDDDLDTPAIGVSTATDLQKVPPAQSVMVT